MSWNNKLNDFSEGIGYPERAVNQDAFSAEEILKRFAEAEKTNYNEMERAADKEAAIAYFQRYLELMRKKESV